MIFKAVAANLNALRLICDEGILITFMYNNLSINHTIQTLNHIWNQVIDLHEITSH